MKIQFLGTGAAEGVPAEFCNCEVCKKARALGGKEIRSRTQVLIDGKVCIDFPPDAYMHAVLQNVDLSAIETLLVTHSHMDHFYAHDFILRGYKYASGMTCPEMRIYGNGEVKAVFAECTRREIRQEVEKDIPVSEMNVFLPYRAGDYTVTAFPALHTPKEQALLFLVEKEGKAYLHLHDTGKVTEETYEYLKTQGKRVQAVAMDCTLVDTHSSTSGRHMGLEENVEVMNRLKADGVANENTKFVITHFSHNSAPFTKRLEKIGKAYGVIPAFDGMTLEI